MMIGTPDGSRASIPEITTRHAADYSHDISLRLLQNIEKTVDSLTEMEHALEWVARAAHAAERSWDEVVPPVEMPKDADDYVRVSGEAAKWLKQLGEVYISKQQAARDDRELHGKNEDLVVTSYDRAITRAAGALEAVESLKWTIMDLQALSERGRSKQYTDLEELISDLNA